jgi:dTDP-4-amino-4,6-dideoxygalactose transaminase
MCGVHYELPIHLQPVYRKMFGFKKGLYPKSEELCKTCLSIPIYPELSSNEISFITDRIHDFFEKKGDM